jgi:hypothetical protein
MLFDSPRISIANSETPQTRHKDDPLYKIHRTPLTGDEHLTDRQRARLARYLPVGKPDAEIEVAWRVYQLVRSIYHAPTPSEVRWVAEKVPNNLHTCPIPEVKRLGKTLRRWRAEILAYFTTGGCPTAHRSGEQGHREDPTPRSRLPELHQLPDPHPARCRPRLTPTDEPTRSDPNHAELRRAA